PRTIRKSSPERHTTLASRAWTKPRPPASQSCVGSRRHPAQPNNAIRTKKRPATVRVFSLLPTNRSDGFQHLARNQSKHEERNQLRKDVTQRVDARKAVPVPVGNIRSDRRHKANRQHERDAAAVGPER